MLLTRFCPFTIKVMLDWYYFALLMFSPIRGKNNINTLTRHPKNVAFQSRASPVMHSSGDCFVLRSKLFQQQLFDPTLTRWITLLYANIKTFTSYNQHSWEHIDWLLAYCSSLHVDLHNITHFTFQTLQSTELSALKVTEMSWDCCQWILVCSEVYTHNCCPLLPW